MGLLIRRHRDRHETDAAAPEVIEGDTLESLRARASDLGLSKQGSKAKLAERIAAHLAEQGAAHDAEADKDPSTEEDPGAGGDNPAAPAPEDGEGAEHTIVAPDPEDDPEGE